MKKLFNNPTVEVESLSPEAEVMGVFSLASSVGQSAEDVVLVEDTKSDSTGDSFGYWSAK